MSQYYSNNYQSPAPPGPPPGPPQGEGLCSGGAVGCCLLIGGMTHILLGILAIAFGAVILSTGELGLVGQLYDPLWGGAIFITAGAIGMASLCCPSLKSCMAGFYIAFCIIAALAALGMTGWEAWLAYQFSVYNTVYCDILNALNLTDDIFKDILGITCGDFRLVYYMRLAAAVVGGVELIVAIVGAIVGCMHCCSDNTDQLNDKMIVAGQNQFAPDPYAQNAAYAQTPSSASYPQMSMSSYPNETVRTSYPNETVRTSYSASNYMQSPTPAPYYNGYGPNPKVHYNGQRATYQPSRYM